MNELVRQLIRHVCDGDIRRAQQQARLVLNHNATKKDEQFKENMLRKLDAKGNLIELPQHLRALLVAEDASDFPEARFLLRKEEEEAVAKVMALYRASERLAELGIPYLPALILHGQSGCGKTMLARYIAHRAGLPFVYVQFSNLVSSYLGSTQANIAKVFEYVRTAPCVLCFDELDAVGMARGQAGDVREMDRIVIALMQELDRLPNNVIIVGTTNRFDRLDPALVRRFPLQYELKALSFRDAAELANRFFAYTGTETSGWLSEWCAKMFGETVPASTVVRECTAVVVQKVLAEQKGQGRIDMDEFHKNFCGNCGTKMDTE